MTADCSGRVSHRPVKYNIFYRRLIPVALAVLALGLTSCAVGFIEMVNSTQASMQRKKWLPAAQQWDPEAQYQVGKTYCCGYQPPFDIHAAIAWYCRAALQGHRNAQFELGRVYAHHLEAYDQSKALNVGKDIAQAVVWYALAAAQGHEEAALRRDELARDMTTDEVAGAKQRMGRWKHLYCLPENY